MARIFFIIQFPEKLSADLNSSHLKFLTGQQFLEKKF